MQIFIKKVAIIGINPYVEVPDNVIQQLLAQSEKNKGPIAVKGMLNGKPFIQTIVKYQGLWRLYLNKPMRQLTQTQVGDTVTVSLEYDEVPRTVEMPQQFKQALTDSKTAQMAFEQLPPYRQKEITRYLATLKTEVTLNKNIKKTIDYLEGKKTEGIWLTYDRSSSKS